MGNPEHPSVMTDGKQSWEQDMSSDQWERFLAGLRAKTQEDREQVTGALDPRSKHKDQYTFPFGSSEEPENN